MIELTSFIELIRRTWRRGGWWQGIKADEGLHPAQKESRKARFWRHFCNTVNEGRCRNGCEVEVREKQVRDNFESVALVSVL